MQYPPSCPWELPCISDAAKLPISLVKAACANLSKPSVCRSVCMCENEKSSLWAANPQWWGTKHGFCWFFSMKNNQWCFPTGHFPNAGEERKHHIPFPTASSNILLLLLLLLLTSTNNSATLLGCLGFLGNLQMMNYLCSWVSKNKQQQNPTKKKEKCIPQTSKQNSARLSVNCSGFFQGLRKPRRLTCHLGANFVLAICVLQACLPILFSFSCLFADTTQLYNSLLWGLLYSKYQGDEFFVRFLFLKLLK